MGRSSEKRGNSLIGTTPIEYIHLLQVQFQVAYSHHESQTKIHLRSQLPAYLSVMLPLHPSRPLARQYKSYQIRAVSSSEWFPSPNRKFEHQLSLKPGSSQVYSNVYPSKKLGHTFLESVTLLTLMR